MADIISSSSFVIQHPPDHRHNHIKLIGSFRSSLRYDSSITIFSIFTQPNPALQWHSNRSVELMVKVLFPHPAFLFLLYSISSTSFLLFRTYSLLLDLVSTAEAE